MMGQSDEAARLKSKALPLLFAIGGAIAAVAVVAGWHPPGRLVAFVAFLAFSLQAAMVFDLRNGETP